ncbi:DHA2 family efflux MFS transporter permease subunit [Reyranella sp.]|uniref:DHA2 family efflux MFS transporter permease subunit n=1 Tax=Reyranella sp. TaxID=1929291 RepID=UPI0037836D96
MSIEAAPIQPAPVQTAQVLSERFGPTYRWLVTVTGMVGVVSMVLAMTTVNVAVPDVMGAFGIGQDKAQWMSSAYMATMTAGMLINAWVVGVLGERRTFVGSLMSFSIGALLGGSAPNEDILIFSRILQGFSAGIAQPLVMATIFTVFPAERRGMAMGVFGLGVVFAPAIGPTLGGLMIEYFSWRYVFYISLPFCVAAAAMGMVFMPTRRIPKTIPAFDWLGFGLLCLALAGLMTGIADGQREGWESDTIVLRLAVGAVATVAFIAWELFTPRALLDMRIFANIEFSAAALIAFIFGAGMMGSTYVIPVFVQTIIGFTPLLAGLMMMPAGIMLAFIFPMAGRLADAFPASTMIIFGLVLFAVGFAFMTAADVDSTFWTLVAMVMVSRLGLGFINPSLNAASLKALPADKVRQGAGVANFMRQLGGAFGINLMVAFFEVRTRFHADALTATQDWGNRTTERLITLIEQLMQKSGLPFQQQKAGALEYLSAMLQAKAQMMAFSDTFIVVGLVALAALIPAAILSRSERRARRLAWSLGGR